MEAGRELDTLIAEKVMQWKVFEGEPGYGRPPEKWSRPSLVLDEIPHYSTDLVSAWQVVEKLRGAGWRVSLSELLSGEWNCRFCPEDTSQYIYVIASTATLAICEAALAYSVALQEDESDGDLP